MSEPNPWLMNGEPVLEIPAGFDTFVYKITQVSTGKSYIGKKLFFFTKTKTVKGKKKKIKYESDWKEYYSSSLEIQKLVAEGEAFMREILHLCKTKGMANYLEAREQMDNRVLENRDLWFNGQIQCRVAANHVKF